MRANSATNGRGQPYDPWSLAFSDTVTRITGNHLMKVGADVRMIRMTTDQLGGTTYTFPNITAFLANQPSAIQYLGDISAPSVFNNGATGLRHTEQEYFVALRAGRVARDATNLTLNYGLRYDYYTPMKERDNLIVKFNTDHRHARSEHDAVPRVEEGQLPAARVDDLCAGQARCSAPASACSSAPARVKTRSSRSRAIASARRSAAAPLLAFPIDQDALVANFTSNPNNRSYAPRAYAPEYNIPERVYQYTASVQQELGGNFTRVGRLRRRAGPQPVPAHHHQPHHQRRHQPEPGERGVRDSRVLDRAARCQPATSPACRIRSPKSTSRPAAATSNYNAMMLSLNRRSANGLSMNTQYTLGRSRGTTGGSNEANTAANNANPQ